MYKNQRSSIHLTIDKDIKQHLNRVLASNGMSISEAIRLYIWQIVTQNGIPFKGFVSTKLAPKKPDELEGIDAEFHERYKELRLRLTEKAFRKLEEEAEQDEEVEVYDPVNDKAIVELFIQSQIDERGLASGTNSPKPEEKDEI